MDHWGSFNIPFHLLFSEIIPCEKSTHLIKVHFVTKSFSKISTGRVEFFLFEIMSTYDKVKCLFFCLHMNW